MMTRIVVVIVVVIITNVCSNGVEAISRRQFPDGKLEENDSGPMILEKNLHEPGTNSSTAGTIIRARDDSSLLPKQRSNPGNKALDNGKVKGPKTKKYPPDMEISTTTKPEAPHGTINTEKQRKTGKTKGRKGGRKSNNNNRVREKFQPYPHADSVQSDSSGGMNYSSIYRKEKDRPMTSFNDKTNEAVKDPTSGPAAAPPQSQAMRYCHEMSCAKGGQCIDDQGLGNNARCQCQLGTKGQFCEKDVVVKYPKFSGSGYMAFPVLRGAFKEFSVDLQFRPDDLHPTGLLLFSSDHPEARFDFFSVALVDGQVEFRFDCGTGMALVRTKNVAEMGKWNTLKIYRHDWNGYVKLNDGPETKGKSKLTGWHYGKNSYGHYQWTYVVPPLTSHTGLDNTWQAKWKTQSDDLSSYRQRFAAFKSPDASNAVGAFFKPKGVFTKMTFREHLFLGGYRNITSIEDRTGVDSGFSGCVRLLRINQKVYDMRKGAFVGDALYGIDVDECNGQACEKVKCLNGGSCASFGADSSLCLCPLGSIGDRCQSKNDVQIASFGGHSYLQFIGLRRTVMSYSEIEIVFKASDPDGVLLYNGYSTDGTGDFISLALHNGTVEYRYDLGTGPAIIRSRQPIKLDAWHTVKAIRNGRNGQLQLDGQEQVEGSSNGAFTQLTLTLDLFIGGHRNIDEVAKAAGISKSLKGCIQKVTINERSVKLLDEALAGINIDDCPHACTTQPCKNGGQCLPLKDQYHCECPLGFENTNCQDRTARYRYRYRYRRGTEYSKQTISTPRFAGDGFLMFTEPEIVQRTRGNKISIQFRLKAAGANGLIFYLGEAGTEHWGDFLTFGLVEGHLQLSYNLGDGETIGRDNETTRIDDDLWHSVKVERYDQTGIIELDGKKVVETFSPGTLKQLNTDGIVYIGGLPDVEERTLGRYSSGLFGCLANITLSSHLSVDLMGDADVASNVGQCG